MVIKINLPNLKKLSFDIPKINIPKPKIDMKILRTSVGYIHDIIGLVPPLKYAVLGITLAADLGTNGKATTYLNDNRKSNSTLSLFPGMSLTFVPRSAASVTPNTAYFNGGTKPITSCI